MKKALLFIGGLCSGIFFVMLWLHRGMISAAVKGEPLPKAPKGCPAYKEEETEEETKEETKEETEEGTEEEIKDLSE